MHALCISTFIVFIPRSYDTSFLALLFRLAKLATRRPGGISGHPPRISTLFFYASRLSHSASTRVLPSSRRLFHVHTIKAIDLPSPIDTCFTVLERKCSSVMSRMYSRRDTSTSEMTDRSITTRKRRPTESTINSGFTMDQSSEDWEEGAQAAGSGVKRRKKDEPTSPIVVVSE